MVASQQEQKHDHRSLHFVLVPYLAPGHFIPMFDIAILLAQRNLIVTVITTPEIASRFASRVARAVQSGHRIIIQTIRFPAAESGLPEGCQTMESTTDLDSQIKFYSGVQKMQQPFKELFCNLRPRPSCLIADNLIPWSVNVAREFDTTRLVFDGMSCFTLVLNHRLQAIYETLPESDSEPFVVPGLPHSIHLNKSQLPMWCDPAHGFTKQLVESETEAYGVVVNSFQEMESEYVSEYRKLRGKRIWCIGPLSMSIKDSFDKAQRGNKAVSSDENHQCLKWLDQHEPGSVVYACLGSLTHLTVPQLAELGMGLEASKHPFIWVIRTGRRDQEIDEWMVNEGFVERVKGSGFVIRGWAPQAMILSHSAIGAFITHCGWNSTIEGVCAGVPMITWPIGGEQFFNEKFLVDVLKTGISLGAQFANDSGQEEKLGVSVKRDTVAEAVEKAIDGGLEGEKRRIIAKSVGEIAEGATDEDGSSYFNLTLLIHNVLEEVNRKGMNLEGSR